MMIDDDRPFIAVKISFVNDETKEKRKREE